MFAAAVKYPLPPAQPDVVAEAGSRAVSAALRSRRKRFPAMFALSGNAAKPAEKAAVAAKV